MAELMEARIGEDSVLKQILSKTREKPKLLFVSPTLPSLTGHGTAMRAGVMLEVLSNYFNVVLVVVHLYRRRRHEPDIASLRLWCEECILFTPNDREEKMLQAVQDVLARHSFDVLHIFRLALIMGATPVIRLMWPACPVRILDLDDFESKSHRRLAALYELNSDRKSAAAHEQAATHFASVEEQMLPQFDEILVCNEIDQTELANLYPSTRFRVTPNAIRSPGTVVRKAASDVFQLLFVGTMDYFPNEDAVTFFCREILPIVRRRSLIPVHIQIVGSRPTRKVLAFGKQPGVEVTGEVIDVSPNYQNADAVIVPVRAGGGTRIKILEAWAYGCPVVSTFLGAEGLSATHDFDLLIADDPGHFADCCLWLADSTERASRLAENGRSTVEQKYSLKNVAAGMGLA